MKKLLLLIGAALGSIFTLFFSNKRGAQVRKEVESKKEAKEKAEVIGEEAKSMMKNFWNAIKGPLKRSVITAEEEVKKYGKEYGSKAIVKMEEWKDMAEKEIKKDMKIAKKEIKKTVKKAKSTAKKKVSQAKKAIKKK